MNKDIVHRFMKLGINVPEILLPAQGIDMSKWCIVACDQYTSQPEYWEEVADFVGQSPSTLHMIFPEIYLGEDDIEKRFQKIASTMEKYIRENILVPQKPCFILVDRKTSRAASRKGLIMAVDMEKYDYSKGAQTLIRTTEGTVVERLPPRIKIRENASIELPHIMLLIDDPEKTVIEPVAAAADKLEMLYDCELMMGGGHVKGYRVDDQKLLRNILEAFEKLADIDAFKGRYGLDSDEDVLLFAVGDGNHSLAAAKAHWEKLKRSLADEEKACHPARFALVEVVNVHDEGLEFEPIHRVVFNVDTDKFLDEAVKYFNANGSQASYKLFESRQAMARELECLKKSSNSHVIPFVSHDKKGAIIVDAPKYNLEVGTLQAFLDELAGPGSKIKIDYIHGEDVVTTLGSKEGNMGFYLPPMDKHDLFKTVILDGALPRKTFSMGEAEEKRFYLECRRIRPSL